MVKHKYLISFVTVIMVLLSHGISANTPSQQFIQFMLPKIKDANQQVLNQRHRLLALAHAHDTQQSISRDDQQWLDNLVKQYDIKNFNINQEKSWQALENRVDMLPTSLILAQAINESGWGKSRFAVQAHNYFGQWCYTQGCGLIPKQRSAGAIHEVQKFANPEASVKSYLHNINTHSTYHELRSIRARERQQGRPLDSLELAEGLSQYSQIRGAYVKMIQHLIESFHLQRYDRS